MADAAPASRSEFAIALGHLLRDPLGLVGLVIVSTVMISALFADWIVPYDPIALNIKDRLQGPSASHWLGADQLGRDTLSRVIMGGRIALQVKVDDIFLQVRTRLR